MRERRDERLAFARGHFRDPAVVQHHAADELHVEVHHVPLRRVIADLELPAHQAARRIFHHCEGLGQDLLQHLLLLVEILDLREPLLPRGRLGAEIVVAQRLVLLLELVDAVHGRPHALDVALVFRADDFL